LGDSGYEETKASEIKMFDNPYKRSRINEGLISGKYEENPMHNERPPLPGRSVYQPLGSIKPYEPDPIEIHHTSYKPAYQRNYRYLKFS
jgi:hypothetical protein